MLGPVLKSTRKNAGFTQATIAKRAGISIPAARHLEAGSGNLASFQKVLQALDLKLWGKNLPAGDTIGGRIVALRRRRSMSQKALASHAKVSHPVIVRLERQSRGRLKLLDQVLSILGAGPVLSARPPAFFTHAGNSSGEQHWNTPAWLLDVLREVFGIFDLDPCAPTSRRRATSVSAKLLFTESDDGLSLPWQGKVFVNPPYGRTLKHWTKKARTEVEQGRASLVVALLPARTDTGWWHDDVAQSATVIFLKGRLSFNETGDSAPFPSALAVWGARPARLRALAKALPGSWTAGPRAA